MNNKGFATTFIMFSLLVLFLIVVSTLMFSLVSSTTLNTRLRNHVENKIYKNTSNGKASQFKSGTIINKEMKLLSGNTSVTENTYDSQIQYIQRSNTLSQATDFDIVSTSNSKNPIYMWYDSNIIYWYCISEKIYLNEDSSYMFKNLSSLKTIDLSGIKTNNVSNMNSMFENDSSLQTIYVSNTFTTNSVTSSSNMFYGDTKLVGGNSTTYNSSYIDKTYARIDVSGTPGYFTQR